MTKTLTLRRVRFEECDMIMCNVDSKTECTILCGVKKGCMECPLAGKTSCLDYKNKTIESLSFIIELSDSRYNRFSWYINFKRILYSIDKRLPLELAAIDILEAMGA